MKWNEVCVRVNDKDERHKNTAKAKAKARAAHRALLLLSLSHITMWLIWIQWNWVYRVFVCVCEWLMTRKCQIDEKLFNFYFSFARVGSYLFYAREIFCLTFNIARVSLTLLLAVSSHYLIPFSLFTLFLRSRNLSSCILHNFSIFADHFVFVVCFQCARAHKHTVW